MPFKNLTRLLTLLALLLAPLGMIGSHAAMAAAPSMPAMAGGGHCAEMADGHDEAPDQQAPGNAIDCMIACSCVLALTAILAEPPARLTPLIDGFEASLNVGLHPEADPPPPRLS